MSTNNPKDVNLIHKKEKGQFFTITNPFSTQAFYSWYEMIPQEKRGVVLEPFAGANHIPKLLNELTVCPPKTFKCYDIDTTHENQLPQYPIEHRDVLADYPKGFSVAITNPPYLAKNSATRNKLNYPNTKHDDLYKYCLEIMLAYTEYVAAIIPESFITSGLFTDRLYAVISLTCKMFDDTECPVCLSLFVPSEQKANLYSDKSDFAIYRMNEKLGLHSSVIKAVDDLLSSTKHHHWVFNDPNGEIGIQCIDNTKEPSIMFVRGEAIDKNKIKVSSRSLTRIGGLPQDMDLDTFIKKCNQILTKYREITNDICLTSFKGLRDDGPYRRRLDFKTARQIMDAAIEN